MPNNMKRVILVFVSLLLLLFYPTAQAQVNNDNKINMQAVLVQGWGKISAETAGGGSNPTFIGKIANDTDGSGTLLLNTAYSTSHLTILNSGVATIGNPPTLVDEWGPVYNSSMGVITGSTSNKFDFSVMSWETDYYREDGQARYQLINCGSEWCTDDNSAWMWSIRTPKLYIGSSEWFQQELDIGSNESKFRMKFAWRYEKGNTGYDALDFGDLSYVSGQRTHVNSNKQPSGASSSLYYADYWGTAFPGTQSFTAGKDVTYEFEISNSKTVVISTDFPETDFDTHIHLISLAEDGTSYSYIVGDDDDGSGTKSIITRDLCPGDYAVVVEGHFSYDQGDFKIGIQASNRLPNPGIVTASEASLRSSKTICPNTAIGTLYGWVAGTAICGGSLNYQWQKSTNNGGWTNISGATSTNLSSTGNIGGSTSVRFRRAVSEGVGGNTAYSNIITLTPFVVNATSGGSIGSSTNVPIPQEFQQVLTSNTLGAALPVPVYSWEKKIGQGSFQTIPFLTSSNYPMPELTETAIYRRKTMSNCPGNNTVFAYSEEITVGVTDPSGVFSGTVTSDKGAPVAGVTIAARRTQAVPGGLVNKTYTTLTGADGTYTLEGLYFGPEVTGAEATFEVAPSKGDHIFDFASLDKQLTNNVPATTANFKDLTVFSVEGKIYQLCATCDGASVTNPDTMALKDVGFKIFPGTFNVAGAFTYVEADSINAFAFKTAADGKYSITLDDQGYYKVIPKYKNHFFAKPDSIINVGMGTNVETAIQSINFADTSTNVISGLVKADCDQYIGRAVLQFTQQIKSGNSYVAGNFIKKYTTNLSSGFYETRLPASTYAVSVTDIIDIPENTNDVPLYSQDEIVDQFFSNTNFFPADSMRKDLSVADSTFNLTFHEKPQIAVIEFDGPNCKPALKLFPIVEQGIPTIIKLGVFQGNPEKSVSYKGNTVFGCPVENDTLRILTNIESGSGIEDTVLVTDEGYVDFNIIPGEPTISGNYAKQFQLDFDDKYGREGGNASKNDVTPVVTGSKIIGNDFVTTSPEIPFLILRDPPGSQSFSFREANTTTEIATSFSTKRTNAKDVWIDVKLGAKFEAGLGVSYESAFWGNLKGGFALTSTNSSSTESITSTTNSNYYSTSAAGIPGDQGDVYYGGALNFLQAAVIEIEFVPDSCKFTSSTNMILAPDGFKTQYAYTEYAIRTEVIPDLETLRDQPSTSANDKRKWTNQINIWQNILDYNARLKAEAKHEYNLSFDSGIGPLTSTVSTSATKVNYIEFEMETDSTLAAEIGMELGGSGLSEGGTISLRMARGGSTTNTTMKETVTGFTIQDGPEGGG